MVRQVKSDAKVTVDILPSESVLYVNVQDLVNDEARVNTIRNTFPLCVHAPFASRQSQEFCAAHFMKQAEQMGFSRIRVEEILRDYDRELQDPRDKVFESIFGKPASKFHPAVAGLLS